MNFDFSEDQIQLADAMRSMLKETWTVPVLRRSLVDPGAVRPLRAGLTELGLMQALAPEGLGGLGMTFEGLALAYEEFGRALVSAPEIETLVATDVLVHHGTGDQLDRWMPGIVDGTTTVACAVQDANAGFDDLGVSLKATRSPDGWRLDGCKVSVCSAADATHLLVAAGDASGTPILFWIASDAVGMSRRDNLLIDPAQRCADVHFDDVHVADADVVGGHAGDAPWRRLRRAGALASALQLLGNGSRAFEMALDYAKVRKQFGREIGAFQAIKHKLSDGYVALESARSVAYYAAWAHSNADEAAADRAVSMAKAACGDASRRACDDSHQIHGGIGFTWEFDLHFHIKRGKFLEYAWGDAGSHRERVMQSVELELLR